jgi:hypothetical protein
MNKSKKQYLWFCAYRACFCLITGISHHQQKYGQKYWILQIWYLQWFLLAVSWSFILTFFWEGGVAWTACCTITVRSICENICSIYIFSVYKLQISHFFLFCHLLAFSVGRKSSASSFIPQYFLFNFLPAVSPLLDVFQFHVKSSCSELSHWSVFFKFWFQYRSYYLCLVHSLYEFQFFVKN